MFRIHNLYRGLLFLVQYVHYTGSLKVLGLSTVTREVAVSYLLLPFWKPPST